MGASAPYLTLSRATYRLLPARLHRGLLAPPRFVDDVPDRGVRRVGVEASVEIVEACRVRLNAPKQVPSKPLQSLCVVRRLIGLNNEVFTVNGDVDDVPNTFGNFPKEVLALGVQACTAVDSGDTMSSVHRAYVKVTQLRLQWAPLLRDVTDRSRKLYCLSIFWSSYY